MILPVLAAENAEVESVKINAPHRMYRDPFAERGELAAGSADKVFVAGI